MYNKNNIVNLWLIKKIMLEVKMFGKRKSPIPAIAYNPETHIPILKCSICTGEQVAGFKDKATGHFTEVMLIRTPQELEKFKKIYNLQNVAKEY